MIEQRILKYYLQKLLETGILRLSDTLSMTADVQAKWDKLAEKCSCKQKIQTCKYKQMSEIRENNVRGVSSSAHVNHLEFARITVDVERSFSFYKHTH